MTQEIPGWQQIIETRYESWAGTLSFEGHYSWYLVNCLAIMLRSRQDVSDHWLSFSL